MISPILKVFLPSLLTFLIGVFLTPYLTTWMYKQRLWKKLAREDNNPDEISVAYASVHNVEQEVRTPRVGGVIIWVSVVLTTIILYGIATIIPADFSIELDYLSFNQTLLPMITLLFGGIFGLFEDFLEINPDWLSRFRTGLDPHHTINSKYLISMVLIVAGVFGFWFYSKLDYHSIFIPILGVWNIGWWFIPYFIIMMLGVFSSRVIDGIDGLAGGVMSIIYGAFGIIGLIQHQYDIAALCFVIAGALLVFLWFNVPPARFYMGETGMMALVLTLPIIAFLLDKSLWIIIIGFPLVATAFSSFIQIISKKYFGKKIFRIAPLHHHFQAIGWSSPKVVMRYWIFSLIAAITGVLLVLVG